MNVVFLIISRVVTTIIQLRNTPSTTQCLWNWTFTPQFFHKSLHASCPRSAFLAFSNFMLIELTPLNEWMLRYRPPNWVRLDPNKRCANFRWFTMTFTLELLWQSLESGQPSQPWLWHLFFKNHPFFFMCSHLKLLKEFLSMTLTLPYQYQKVINSSLPSKSNKITKYP
jgi:hypothetical protein